MSQAVVDEPSRTVFGHRAGASFVSEDIDLGRMLNHTRIAAAADQADSIADRDSG